MSARSVSPPLAADWGPRAELLPALSVRRGGDLDREVSGEEVLRRARRPLLTGDLARLCGGDRETDREGERLRAPSALRGGGEGERDIDRLMERA